LEAGGPAYARFQQEGVNKKMIRSIVKAGLAGAFSLAAMLAAVAMAGDWPQWRGPERNGVVPGTAPLVDAFPEGGLKPVWISERIPGNNNGGWGSVVVADGRAYVYSNWRYTVPIKQRTLDAAGLKGLGWIKDFPRELAAKVEAARLSEERAKLEGNAVPAWTAKWADTNLTRDDGNFRATCLARLRAGKGAISADTCRRIESIVDREFASQAALEEWLAQNGIAGPEKDAVLRAVPTARPETYDKVYCLDALSGKTVWQKEFPGVRKTYCASGTPCVVGGRCYVNGSGGSVYCLDAATGEVVWQGKSPGDRKETSEHDHPSSSLVVQDGLAILLSTELVAFNASTGKVAWVQADVRGDNASAAYWRHDGNTYLVCNGQKETFCFEPATGRIVWRVAGGGWCTPAIAGDRMVGYSSVELRKEAGLAAYDLSASTPRKMWNIPCREEGASVIIRDGYVYAIGEAEAARAMCVELETGRVVWTKTGLPRTELSSPVLVDGKLLYIMDRSLSMLQATPAAYRLLAKADLKASVCTTPAVVDGMVYLRMADNVACYDLRKRAEEGRSTDSRPQR
jgi:outer membrane protein assembly factor BamB